MVQSHKGIKYKFFWSGFLSNWYGCQFKVDGIWYNCGEQYMMYQKAILFNDAETANKILYEKEPEKQKKLGRQVKNFDPEQWDAVKYELVKKGLREKFKQNLNLKRNLLLYKDCQIVEASPYDEVWGIGFYDYNAIRNIDDWGENLLGKILTELAVELS